MAGRGGGYIRRKIVTWLLSGAGSRQRGGCLRKIARVWELHNGRYDRGLESYP